jgi:hypothetical protein
MSEAEVKSFLKENGYPEHIVKGGKKGLIAAYEKFVAEVEKGYSLNLEDYRNDLDGRALLSRLALQSEIEDADRRFRACLVFATESVWDCDDNPDAFWLYGYPRNAKDDLLEDLRNEGFID